MKNWKVGQDYPSWMTPEALVTLSKGYTLDNETPRGMYMRLAKSAANHLGEPEMYERFFEVMWKGWLCPASPVLSNLGTDRGLPISCFGMDVPDSIEGIYDSAHELAVMTKNGGGVGMNLSTIRGRGEPIKGGKNGYSEGVVPWAKIYDSAILATSQGGVRKGAVSFNLKADHIDAKEFLRIRRPQGDINRQTLNSHHCMQFSDKWMNEMLQGDPEKQSFWIDFLKTRIETGEPYVMFTDNVERGTPDAYKLNNLKVDMTNICCLTGETLIATSHGPQQIRDLVDKEVEIFDGESWVKNSNFRSYGKGEVLKITLKDGSEIKCTPNHRWFAIKDDYNHIRRNEVFQTYAKDLEVGMYLEFHEEECHGIHKEEGAYIKGFLLGDGTYGSAPILNLHSTKYMCEDRLLDSLNSCRKNHKYRSDSITTPMFSDEVSYPDQYGKQVYKRMKGLSCRSDHLKFWCTEVKTQGLPEAWICWDKETKIEFLSGLFDADATGGRFIQISQVSEKLIKDIQMMLKSLNISSAIDYANKPRLTLSSTDSYRFYSMSNMQRVSVDSMPKRKLTGWRKIASIEYVEDEEVFCTTVPSTTKFALANGLMTGNSEITLHTDDDHSFICCLSSMNLMKWDEWQGTDAVAVSIKFLNGVLNEFIKRASEMPMMARAVRSAVKGRAIGLGVLGWHSLLQSKMLPMHSFQAKMMNKAIFKHIREESYNVSRELAKRFGEPEWCRGTGRYNSHTMAVAPTRTNSIIAGKHSHGIEPISFNAYADKSAKGVFLTVNPELKKLLEAKGKDNFEVWNSIVTKEGSVQHLDFLSEEEKEVFLTAYEISQFTLIDLAGDRQQYIDQAQSLNLFFPADVDPKLFHKVHVEAWKRGVKTLYYVRSSSVLKADVTSRSSRDLQAVESGDCAWCEG
jgi:ribonucleoside-diphosphate reductase alpha chain